MQTIKLLASLQKIDLELDAARRTFADNKQAMQPSAELQNLARQVKAAEAQLAHWRKERRQQDGKVAEATAKIADLEKKLYGGMIKNAREQVAMQQNIEALKRHLATLEETAMLTMMEQEEAEKKLSDLQERFAAAKQVWLEQKATLEKAQEKLVADARKLKARRQQLAATLPPAELQRYEALRKKFGGMAIAPVQGRNCGGCGASLPTAVLQKINEGQEAKCPICGRLLYKS